MRVARSELILGGQKSGKTARAEALAAQWLSQAPRHEAVYIATAQAWDEEMRERIERHRRDRAERVPRMRTVEEPLALAQAIGHHSRPDTLIVVDCLTLWLTARLMPAVPGDSPPGATSPEPGIATAVASCAGPLVLISNEIGLGVVPLGRDVRQFVDALGTLNQEAAAACERVTLMSAGLALTLKGSS
ncbi:MAG TPA: bifunctional adenosylcobinamide kinase/adenosylcobinamide-phosphate guanylyltransferase [Ramlibacter sp.]|nr:bifunctional adenosylcobinamide kinase/adenosylcobinamide-phosphate guanylyltransferase [Ramlibacter sp.]